jgi:hypothetical protein
VSSTRRAFTTARRKRAYPGASNKCPNRARSQGLFGGFLAQASSRLRGRLEKLEQHAPAPEAVECSLLDPVRGMVSHHDGRSVPTKAFKAPHPGASEVVFRISRPTSDRDLMGDDEAAVLSVPGAWTRL